MQTTEDTTSHVMCDSALYLEWALEHMAKIHKAMLLLEVSDTNLLPMRIAMDRECDALIATNPHYAVADRVLRKIGYYADDGVVGS
jgi:hypothetical protein